MTTSRETPIQISKEEFQKIGHRLVDDIANFISSMEERSVTSGESPRQLQELLGVRSLPDQGSEATGIISKGTTFTRC